MNRIATLERHGTADAVVLDDGSTITYAELADRADRVADRLPPRRTLGILRCSVSLDTLVTYLAALRHRHPVVMVDGAVGDGVVDQLVDAFEAQWVMDADGMCTETGRRPMRPIDRRAAVMLPTSGTTGSPKHVVLSAANLDENAESIAQFLDIGPDERPLTSLPLHYSYGLSVVNSHLLRGAALLLTSEPMTSRPFWDAAATLGATSLAGVPTHYQVLLRLGLDKLWVPTLRTLTQAGGPLPEADVRRIHSIVAERNARFFVMYGQTEATARMAYLPPDRLPEKAGCVGVAIPGGALRLVDKTGRSIDDADVEGELVYSGRNVMQGYASNLTDLAVLMPPRELHTGDLAVRDVDGLFRITGRLKRIVKLRGHRIGLDELERVLLEDGHEVICGGSDDRLVIGHRPEADRDGLLQCISQRCRIPTALVSLTALAEWPTTTTGKIDYADLAGTP